MDTLLATEDNKEAAAIAGPSTLPSVSEGRRERGLPERDKARKFNLGACLQQQDELRVLSMLENNSDRFAFSMEDIEPDSFNGEAMRIDLNTDKTIFRSSHKLGQVEWDFVEA